MQIISQQLSIFVCFILGIIYQCRVCRFTFSQQKFLSKHSKKCKDGKFKCKQCYKGFASQQNLKTHCSRVHQEHRYECPTCGIVFNWKFNLKTHRLIHSDTMDYTCDQCGKQFKHKNSLAMHTHTHEPYKCKDCAKDSNAKVQLTNTVCVNLHSVSRNTWKKGCGSQGKPRLDRKIS